MLLLRFSTERANQIHRGNIIILNHNWRRNYTTQLLAHKQVSGKHLMNYFSTTASPSLRGERSQSFENAVAIALMVVSLFAIGYTLYNISDLGDWKIFHSALQTIRPFDTPGYFNPPIPTATMIIYPFTTLPYRLGGTLWNLFSIIAIGMCVIRLSKDKILLRLVLSFTLIPIVAYLDMAQICVLSVIGLTLLEVQDSKYLKAIGASLLLLKPQIAGMSIFVFWKESSRIEKAVFCLIFLSSFVVYGFWILDMYASFTGNTQVSQANNISIFPYGVPVGVGLLLIGMKRNNYLLATISTAFLSPYVNAYSLFPFMAYIFAKTDIRLMIILYIVIQFLYIYTY